MQDATNLINSPEYHNSVNGKTVKTVNPPVYNGSTVLFENYEDFYLAHSGKYNGITYGTDRLPTQRAFDRSRCRSQPFPGAVFPS